MTIRKLSKACKGFTLIELLAVIAIMGMFAFAVVPEVVDFHDRTKRARANNDLPVLADAIKRYMSDRQGVEGNTIHPLTDIVALSNIWPVTPDTHLTPSTDVLTALYSYGYLSAQLLDPWDQSYSINIQAPSSIEMRSQPGVFIYHGDYVIRLHSLGRDKEPGTADDIKLQYSARVK